MLSRILPLCNHNYYIERVKFGVPLDQVCCIHNDIPGPLLILILKLNKEGPYKKDVFRAPGHQANMKKLIHFLQTGRLVNIDNFSVYTIASVLKKFLRKLPGGIFGHEAESRLFEIIEKEDTEEKREEINRLITSLPPVHQHLLVLLFGTFRAIASTSKKANTGMTSEALGVSVAPSFLQSCVSDGCKIAKMEDVHRYKVATMIMKFLIDNFGVSNLFGRENYEYYARISGRVLKVEENWIFAFKYPPDSFVSPISSCEECQSTPTLCPSSASEVSSSACKAVDKGAILADDVYARLSMSLEESFFKVKTTKSNPSTATTSPTIITTSSPIYHHHYPQQLMHESQDMQEHEDDSLNLEQLRQVNRYAESTKSLSFLPIVHERQTQRMKTRSEWFLNPGEIDVPSSSSNLSNPNSHSHPTAPSSTIKSNNKNCGSGGGVIRRTSSKEKRLVRRSSSKKDKENGNKSGPSSLICDSTSPTTSVLSGPTTGSSTGASSLPSHPSISSPIACTDMDVSPTLAYKPRI
ncbi:rho GTPase-activating protein 20 [Tetranychus urticae]|uniref:rho GTPase-activating protein 20 n=1 Tax=Tetranychus urticae TaxID=32264 RepID=UPI00077BADEE|nr:rho GTPase-activating protein 20 [Tetranychus urticae]